MHTKGTSYLKEALSTHVHDQGYPPPFPMSCRSFVPAPFLRYSNNTEGYSNASPKTRFGRGRIPGRHLHALHFENVLHAPKTLGLITSTREDNVKQPAIYRQRFYHIDGIPTIYVVVYSIYWVHESHQSHKFQRGRRMRVEYVSLPCVEVFPMTSITNSSTYIGC